MTYICYMPMKEPKICGIPSWYPADLKEILRKKPAIVRAFILSSQALRLNVYAKGLGWAGWSWKAPSKRAEIYRLDLRLEQEQAQEEVQKDQVDLSDGILSLLLLHWWQSEIKGCPPVTEVCLWENPETPIRVLPPTDQVARISVGRRRRRV